MITQTEYLWFFSAWGIAQQWAASEIMTQNGPLMGEIDKRLVYIQIYLRSTEYV